jgi:hypothetical protein
VEDWEFGILNLYSLELVEVLVKLGWLVAVCWWVLMCLMGLERVFLLAGA